MTVAEKIKRSTKPLTLDRAGESRNQRFKTRLLMDDDQVLAVEYQFIDGSKLTCRVYW